MRIVTKRLERGFAVVCSKSTLRIITRASMDYRRALNAPKVIVSVISLTDLRCSRLSDAIEPFNIMGLARAFTEKL